jgi:predicted RNA methylase
VALLERILLAASNEGDLVLDPFMGSGTAALAALRLRRAAVGLELDGDFIGLALARMCRELFAVCVAVQFVESKLDLFAGFVDRSVSVGSNLETPPPSRLVYREAKFFFVGSYRREVIYSVVALDLDDAWRHFRSSPQSAHEVISIIKTETEIYLAQ